MPFPNAKLLLFCISTISLASSFAQTNDNVPLTFTRLDLTDGRTLKDVVVKSYDVKSEKLLLIASGKAMIIPIAFVPPPFNQQLKSAPAPGMSVSTIAVPPAAPSPAVRMEGATPAAPQQRAAMVYREASPTRPMQRPELAVSASAKASLAQHHAAAHARAQKYFRYEFQIGSSSIRVTSLDFELGAPTHVPGWTGRCRTEGKAFIEYFDSKGRSFQRTTSTFEVMTEQKPGEELKVIDFSRKS